MNTLGRFATTLGILSALLVATAGLAQNKPTATPKLPSTKPNTTFNVQRQKGKCPLKVSLWTLSRNYEGGGELTAIADTLAIATSPRLASSGKSFVEYKARLKSAYASCVGRASSQQQPMYKFRFSDRNVYFRVDLTGIPQPTAISYKNVVADRPYVRWAIAD
ncbi:MAG TPA: hypothetical protein V6D12_05680 [Candidatus Obscuribacterales bacterium]